MDGAIIQNNGNLGLYFVLSWKYKISEIWLIGTGCIFLIFLIAIVQTAMECETEDIYETYICSRYSVNQQLIVQNLYSVSINKILVTELLLWKFHRI